MSTSALQQTVADNDWIRQSFLLSAGYISDADAINRVFSTASLKFVDTRLGGNFCINNVPQYTRYADIKQGSLMSPLTTSSIGNVFDPKSNNGAELPVTDTYGGLGRFYSEQIDDNSQLIHLQFGIPEFTGMFSFFTGMYNNAAGSVARTGSISDTAGYWLGRATGFVASLYFMPLLAVGYGLRFLTNSPSSKFYYMKPAMAHYWDRVNSIVNSIGVNMGIVAPLATFKSPADYSVEGNSTSANTNPGTLSDSNEWTNTDRAKFHQAMPSLYGTDGGIDIYAMANRAQRLADINYNRIRDNVNKLASPSKSPNPSYPLGKMGPTDAAKHTSRSLTRYILDYQNTFGGPAKLGTSDTSTVQTGFRPSWGNAPATASQTAPTQTNPTATASAAAPGITVSQYQTAVNSGLLLNNSDWTQNVSPSWTTTVGNAILDGWHSVESAVGSFWDSAKADIQDGNQFVTFRVDHTGTVSESFSNSFRQSDIASKINGASANARNLEFDFADGNTGLGAIDSISSALKGFVGGALDSIHMSGLLSLAGAAFVDIPEQWDNSSAQFPTASYTIELRTAYGNQMSRFQNLMVPLAMLLAGALPIATGKQSYQSPFLCSLFSRGRVVSRLAMISELSITRGVGNVGWTPNGNFLGIDVSITVKDLSSVMYAPINPTYGSLNPLQGWFDEDNSWSDYMNTLSSMSLANQYYPMRKMLLNIERKVAFTKSQWTSAAIANSLMDTTPGRWLSAFARPAAVSGAH